MEMGDINREDNMITLMAAFHDDFSHFRFILEATSIVHRYKIKTFPNSMRRLVISYMLLAREKQLKSYSRTMKRAPATSRRTAAPISQVFSLSVACPFYPLIGTQSRENARPHIQHHTDVF
jgi:hypothetical protein